MDDTPLVSIVIPTYNHAGFLKEALDGVVRQTYANWEAIVVNNYSEDDTDEVVHSFNDSRIKHTYFRNHGIIAASRNEGIRLAAGEWVSFLDSDDKWYPEKLVETMKYANSSDVICHGLMITRDGIPWQAAKSGTVGDISLKQLLFSGNCVATSAVMVKRKCLQAVGGFDETPEMVTAEDYDLWIRLAAAGLRFAAFSKVLGEYRWHQGSASKAILRNLKAELIVINKNFAILDDKSLFLKLLLRRRIAFSYYSAARGYHHEGQKREAIRHYLKSLKCYPFSLRTYAGLAGGLFGTLTYLPRAIRKELRRH